MYRPIYHSPAVAVHRALGGAAKRREDPRLITGAGRYTDDVKPEGCLHAVFVRSTMAHARLVAIDRSAALGLPGVVGAYVAADLGLKPQEAAGMGEFARPPLAAEVVRLVGDLIAVAVPESGAAAMDAALAVMVDYEPRPVLANASAALEAGAPVLHPAKSDNIASNMEFGEPGALDGAEVVVRARFVNQRLAAVPIEGNAVVAEPDGAGGVRMWVSTQVPFRVRYEVSELAGLPEEKVRVITGDVGGGFGAKLATYPEQSILASLAVKLQRPVAWSEYRSENLVAMTHGRA